MDFADKEFYQAKYQKLMQTKIKKVTLRNLQIEDYKELKKSMKMLKLLSLTSLKNKK